MSSSSRSGSHGHYPNQNHGGGHYKRPHNSGGILGKIVDALTGSKRHSRSDSDHNDRHHSNRRQRRSSWS